jgi:hypothetical protein
VGGGDICRATVSSAPISRPGLSVCLCCGRGHWVRPGRGPIRNHPSTRACKCRASAANCFPTADCRPGHGIAENSRPRMRYPSGSHHVGAIMIESNLEGSDLLTKAILGSAKFQVWSEYKRRQKADVRSLYNGCKLVSGLRASYRLQISGRGEICSTYYRFSSVTKPNWAV